MGWLSRVIRREYVFLFKGLYISLPPTLPPLFFFFLKSRLQCTTSFCAPAPHHKHTPYLSTGVVSTHIMIFVDLWSQVPRELCQRTMHTAGCSTHFPVNEPGPPVLVFSNPHIFSTAYSFKQ